MNKMANRRVSITSVKRLEKNLSSPLHVRENMERILRETPHIFTPAALEYMRERNLVR